MGASGEDVPLSQAARVLVPFQIECKNKHEISVYKMYEQACEHGSHQPLLVVKQDYKDPLVIVDAEFFFNLIRKLQQLG